MSQSRLRTALDDGLFALPEGNIAVLRPPATYDMAALPRHAVQVVHGFYPDHAAWRDAGYPTTQDAPQVATAIVVVPRAKALARAMIAAACAVADFVVVDGQKTDGVDSVFKACRKQLGELPSITKAHGRLFWFQASDAFEDWAAPPPQKGAHGFFTSVNVEDPRVTFHWADATRFDPASPYDGIVMNPPFHAGRASDPGLGRAFIQAAARLLAPHGKLWMVANRHLPYETTLSECFRNVDMITSNGAFKVFHANRPTR